MTTTIPIWSGRAIVPGNIPLVDGCGTAEEIELREAKRFLHSTLDALSAHIAILDENGTIIEVNAAWNNFGHRNDLKCNQLGVGLNYLKVCDSVSGTSSDGAAAVSDGIRAVMAGQREEFHLEYPCHSPLEKLWFIVRVTRFGGDGLVRVVVAHENITERKQAEEAMRKGELQLAHAMSLAHLVSWEYDVASGLFTFGDSYYALHGTTSELEGGNLMSAEVFALKFVHPDDVYLVADEVAKAVATPDPDYVSQLECRLLRRDGTLRHVLVHISIAKDAAGQTVRLCGANQDITERKQSEEALRNLWRAVEQTPTTVVITNVSGNIEYVNPKFVESTGFSVADAVGQNPRVLKSGLHDASFYKAMWDTLLQGNVWQGEIYNKKKNGDLYWEAASISPVRDPKGKITHFIAVKEDISERKQAEEALREKERLLSEAQRLGHVGSWFGDMTGPLSWSEETYRIYGVSPDTFIPTMESLLALVHPEDRSVVLDWQVRCAVGQKSDELEFRITRPDGSIRSLKRNGEAVYDADKRFIHMAGTVQDITEQKQAQADRETFERRMAEYRVSEENARLALEHEKRSSQIRNRFASMVSHEFRTPLSVILTAVQLLDVYSDRLTDAERSEQLMEIQISVNRMTQMMTDFLVHGNCTSGNLECKPMRVAVEVLCRQLVAEVPSYSGPARQIKCVVDPEVGEAWLDEKIVRHILGNLLSNAVKYSLGSQPVKLEVKLVADSQQPNGGTDMATKPHLEFKVSDSGIGIPAADIAKLYQPFHRASNVSNRPGTGMGLAIVKQFVDLLRGNIRIETKEGKGTVVWVELPMVSPASTAES